MSNLHTQIEEFVDVAGTNPDSKSREIKLKCRDCDKHTRRIFVRLPDETSLEKVKREMKRQLAQLPCI